MARDPAARKAAKEVRRKAVVAAKRAMESASIGLGGQVRQGARLPVLRCLVSNDLFHSGAGVVVLARGASPEYQYLAFFMVDTFCLGVKDVFFRAVDRHALEGLTATARLSENTSPMAPEEARKLLRDVVAWAHTNGFPPHRDYARIEPLFGDVTPAAIDYRPRFGCEGNVLYMPGPSESLAEVRRRAQTVRSHGGSFVAPPSLLHLPSALAGDPEFMMDDDEC